MRVTRVAATSSEGNSSSRFASRLLYEAFLAQRVKAALPAPSMVGVLPPSSRASCEGDVGTAVLALASHKTVGHGYNLSTSGRRRPLLRLNLPTGAGARLVDATAASSSTDAQLAVTIPVDSVATHFIPLANPYRVANPVALIGSSKYLSGACAGAASGAASSAPSDAAGVCAEPGPQQRGRSAGPLERVGDLMHIPGVRSHSVAATPADARAIDATGTGRGRATGRPGSPKNIRPTTAAHRLGQGVVADVRYVGGIKSVVVRSTVLVRNTIAVAVLVQFERADGSIVSRVRLGPTQEVYAPLAAAADGHMRIAPLVAGYEGGCSAGAAGGMPASQAGATPPPPLPRSYTDMLALVDSEVTIAGDKKRAGSDACAGGGATSADPHIQPPLKHGGGSHTPIELDTTANVRCFTPYTLSPPVSLVDALGDACSYHRHRKNLLETVLTGPLREPSTAMGTAMPVVCDANSQPAASDASTTLPAATPVQPAPNALPRFHAAMHVVRPTTDHFKRRPKPWLSNAASAALGVAGGTASAAMGVAGGAANVVTGTAGYALGTVASVGRLTGSVGRAAFGRTGEPPAAAPADQVDVAVAPLATETSSSRSAGTIGDRRDSASWDDGLELETNENGVVTHRKQSVDIGVSSGIGASAAASDAFTTIITILPALVLENILPFPVSMQLLPLTPALPSAGKQKRAAGGSGGGGQRGYSKWDVGTAVVGVTLQPAELRQVLFTRPPPAQSAMAQQATGEPAPGQDQMQHALALCVRIEEPRYRALGWSLLQLQDKFRLDIDDEAADQVFLKLVDESVAALFPAFFEVLHKIRVAMR